MWITNWNGYQSHGATTGKLWMTGNSKRSFLSPFGPIARSPLLWWMLMILNSFASFLTSETNFDSTIEHKFNWFWIISLPLLWRDINLAKSSAFLSSQRALVRALLASRSAWDAAACSALSLAASLSLSSPATFNCCILEAIASRGFSKSAMKNVNDIRTIFKIII